MTHFSSFQLVLVFSWDLLTIKNIYIIISERKSLEQKTGNDVDPHGVHVNQQQTVSTLEKCNSLLRLIKI